MPAPSKEGVSQLELEPVKIVLKAESLIYAVMDAEGAVDAISADNTQAEAWLGGEAWAIEKMVDEIVNDEEFDPDMTNATLDEHAYLEEGDGEVWEYQGKRAEKIDVFLPQLTRALICEIDSNLRKQVSVRIKKNALDDAYDALSALTHGKLSEI